MSPISYPIQAVLRAAAPIAVDYVTTRYGAGSKIAGLGTLVLVNRKASDFEIVVNTLLYIAYKFFRTRFLRQEEMKPAQDLYQPRNEAPRVALLPAPPLAPLEVLQQQFNKFIPYVDFQFSNHIAPSTIIRFYFNDSVCKKEINEMVRLAEADMNKLYEELLKETELLAATPERRHRMMAQFLTNKNHPKRYYERFCDPSKPTLLFFYRFVRGCVHFTSFPNQRQSHAFALTIDQTQPFFTLGTDQYQWRETYNSMVDKWSGVTANLFDPGSEVRQWIVKDLQQVPTPDNSSEVGFKILHSKLRLGL